MLLGADYYEADDDAPARGANPKLGVGRDAVLDRVIVDKNARIGDGARLVNEKRVDTLLKSPRYGERMAMGWLDLARYADTHGYHIDSHREMWHWRDWVINAFNRNMPYDQFTIEQLAGDLLPNATVEQRLASGFNRNHMINFEGGAIPEEYQVEYVVDRVEATSTTWLGLTMGCARCHDHKYDPFSQRDYYSMQGLFAASDLFDIKGDGSRTNNNGKLAIPLPAPPLTMVADAVSISPCGGWAS